MDQKIEKKLIELTHLNTCKTLKFKHLLEMKVKSKFL
jgi:hypothetical protein